MFYCTVIRLKKAWTTNVCQVCDLEDTILCPQVVAMNVYIGKTVNEKIKLSVKMMLFRTK